MMLFDTFVDSDNRNTPDFLVEPPQLFQQHIGSHLIFIFFFFFLVLFHQISFADPPRPFVHVKSLQVTWDQT